MRSQSGSIDSEVIARFRRLTTTRDPHFFEDMVTLFAADSEKRLSSMREALEHRNFDRLARDAHGLGGGASIVGAYHLAEICAPLQQAPTMTENEIHELIETIQEEYAEVRRQLELALKSSTSIDTGKM
jgi:HPt (histidine-containing phosphotransfer) domain-containing protein